MGKELLLVAEALSNEKGVKKEVVLEAIQSALESATRKVSAVESNIRVHLDAKTGEYETYRYWTVVSDDAVMDSQLEIGLTEAQQRQPTIELGSVFEESIPSIDFGRI